MDKSPIIIIGAGRSGSTLLHHMICRHPRLAWLTTTLIRFPSKPHWNRVLLRAADLPLIGPALRSKSEGREVYPFWNRLFPGFSTPCRDLVAADLTVSTQRRLQEALQQCVTAKRDRLLIKITGWPRIGLMKALFDDAKFVHVRRDGRAFAYSVMQMPWWHGWGGPEKWRWGPLTREQQALWERHDRSFLVLAGIQWIKMMEAMDHAKSLVDDRQLLEVDYEDLCEDPHGVMDGILKFTGLGWEPAFEHAIRAWKVSSANTKWKTDLTPEQQETLQSALGEYLEKYGYGHK